MEGESRLSIGMLWDAGHEPSNGDLLTILQHSPSPLCSLQSHFQCAGLHGHCSASLGFGGWTSYATPVKKHNAIIFPGFPVRPSAAQAQLAGLSTSPSFLRYRFQVASSEMREAALSLEGAPQERGAGSKFLSTVLKALDR